MSQSNQRLRKKGNWSKVSGDDEKDAEKGDATSRGKGAEGTKGGVEKEGTKCAKGQLKKGD